MKLPAGLAVSRVQCPVCRTPLTTKREGNAPKVAVARALPVERNIAPEPKVRGSTKEAWEPAHPAMKTVTFQAPVNRIGEDVPVVDEPEPVVRRFRRQSDKLEWEADEEDDDVPAAVVMPARTRRWLLPVVVGGGLAAVVTVVALIRMATTAPTDTPLPSAAPTVAAGAEAGAAPATPAKVLVRGVPEADYEAVRDTLTRFLAADSVEKLLPLVRDSARVEPALRAHYATKPLSPLRLRVFPERTDVMRFGALYSGFIETADFEKRLFAMEQKDGAFFVDWEAFTGWGEVPWAELPEKRPTTPVKLRAHVQLDDYYNFAYTDTAKWGCFRIGPISGEQVLYGYAPRKSSLFTTLRDRCRNSPLVLAVLKVRYSEGSTTRDQVEITDFVCAGWVEDAGEATGVDPGAVSADQTPPQPPAAPGTSPSAPPEKTAEPAKTDDFSLEAPTPAVEPGLKLGD